MKILGFGTLLIATSLSMMLSGTGFAASSEALVLWDSVPKVVQETITGNAGGQQVVKIEKETDNDAITYEANVINADKSELVIKVRKDGKLASIKKKSAEVEIPWNSVPTAVQKTLTVNAAGKTVGRVEKEIDDGKLIYEGRVFNGDESRLVIKVADDGTLISNKTRQGFPGQQWANDTKISIADARATALKLQPGLLIDQELEKEDGGSGLRYSFDIKTEQGIRTVDIDAVTGKPLNNSAEDADPDGDGIPD